MANSKKHKLITFLIALVWIVNGFFCKFLGLVSRHEEIVHKISSFDRASAHFATLGIGILEVFMAIWILSNFKARLNAITQITIIATMNIIEFFMAPDLLLWEKFNSVFAFLFIMLIYYNAFYLDKNTKYQN